MTSFNSAPRTLWNLTSSPVNAICSSNCVSTACWIFVAKSLRERGYAVDMWAMHVDELNHLPGFSPVTASYDNALNVVGSHRPKTKQGHSLILNGHIDVAPAGPLNMWTTPPFVPRVENGWHYGRGSGDMKAGIAANIYAIEALKRCGYAPAAELQ